MQIRYHAKDRPLGKPNKPKTNKTKKGINQSNGKRKKQPEPNTKKKKRQPPSKLTIMKQPIMHLIPPRHLHQNILLNVFENDLPSFLLVAENSASPLLPNMVDRSFQRKFMLQNRRPLVILQQLKDVRPPFRESIHSHFTFHLPLNLHRKLTLKEEMV